MARPARRAPSLLAGVRALAVLVVAAVVLAGCRSVATVDVSVAEDGSGVVAVVVDVDRAALAQLGDPSALALEDLRAAGWDVPGPTSTPDGGLRLEARRAFAGPDDLAGVLDELGVFSATSLTLEDSFASTDYAFGTRIELTGSLEQFSDPELSAVLGGVPLGWTTEELTAAGATAPGAAELVLRVELPGGATAGDGGPAQWRFPLTGGTATAASVEATSQVRPTVPLVLVGAGAALVLAGAVALAFGLGRRRSRTAVGGGP